MTYNPNIPNPGDNISDSQPQIKINFQQLENIFGNDHFPWDYATAAQRGQHQQVNFPVPLVVDPSTNTNRGTLYTKADVNDTSARPQMYYQNINGVNAVQQVTNRFHDSSANGYWMIPLGSITNPSIIFMWGKEASGVQGNNAVSFNTINNYNPPGTKFPTNVFNVQVQIISSNNANPTAKSATVTSVTTSGFTAVLTENATSGFYWFAIGN